MSCICVCTKALPRRALASDGHHSGQRTAARWWWSLRHRRGYFGIVEQLSIQCHTAHSARVACRPRTSGPTTSQCPRAHVQWPTLRRPRLLIGGRSRRRTEEQFRRLPRVRPRSATLWCVCARAVCSREKNALGFAVRPEGGVVRVNGVRVWVCVVGCFVLNNSMCVRVRFQPAKGFTRVGIPVFSWLSAKKNEHAPLRIAVFFCLQNAKSR